MKRAFLVTAAMFVARTAYADAPATLDACLSASEQAQLARDEGHYAHARRLFAKCAQDTCPLTVRNDCTKSVVEVAAMQPSVVFGVQDDGGQDLRDVSISVDGEPLVSQIDGRPVEVDPGSHAFTFSAAKQPTKTITLVVRSGEKNRLVNVRFDAPEKTETRTPPVREQSQGAAPPPTLSLVLGGIGIAAIGAGTIVALGARSDLSALESAPCAATRTCAESDVDSVRTRLVVGDVLLATGVVAIGAAVVLWLTSR